MISVGLLVLLALGLTYARTATSFHGGLFACRVAPQTCDGARQVLPLYRVDGVAEDGFTVSKVARNVRVVAEPAGLEVGDTVSVSGTFRAADGAVVATSVQTHGLRRHKKALGLLALVLALTWAPRCFAWRGGHLVLRG